VLTQAKALDLNVDVVILDYHMPHMNGADVARVVRQNKSLDSVPIILLTSVDTAMQGAEFQGIRIDAHLMKPARSSLLFDTIVSAIREARTLEHDTTVLAQKPKSLEELGERMHLQTAPVSTNPLMPAPVEVVSNAKSLEVNAPVTAVKVDAPKNVVATLDILVAEDNAVNQIVFTQILEGLPYTFEIVDNGRKAVEAMQAKAPTLILMDVSMPEMNGMEATQAIRAYEAENGKRHTPIIGVTAHALKGDRDRCIESGMDDYLSKPISPDMLATKIELHMASMKAAKSA
jgi:CheY-like chemotaxis protein